MYFSIRTMISIVDKYFSLNRILLLLIGLWPYQKSKFSRFHLFCCYSAIATVIIFQLTTFLTSKYTANHMIKICSIVFGFTIFFIQYNSFCFNNDTIKFLMGQLQLIYNNLNDNNEIAIFERYGNISKRYTIAFIRRQLRNSENPEKWCARREVFFLPDLKKDEMIIMQYLRMIKIKLDLN
ncbi:uncharacterized protein LOC105833377 isoform X2 [Monomorium pharaonis]|uniref:uncharacterized protein LOC105833377 isoform X2 n=1 Tax=Monomorium pharaonis TaxID=307658 RepID=UPI001746E3DD|nr:uncharacterized protein LOC105833377 isoform X2 [Monomorium pharaonis]